MQPFPAPGWVQIVLLASAAYLALIGLWRSAGSASVRGKSS
jgi:hypothetical protein